MPHTKNGDVERPFSRRIQFLRDVGSNDTLANMVAVAASADRICSLVCPEHGISPAIGTTFGDSGYVSGCCEALLDSAEKSVHGGAADRDFSG